MFLYSGFIEANVRVESLIKRVIVGLLKPPEPNNSSVALVSANYYVTKITKVYCVNPMPRYAGPRCTIHFLRIIYSVGTEYKKSNSLFTPNVRSKTSHIGAITNVNLHYNFVDRQLLDILIVLSTYWNLLAKTHISVVSKIT